MTDTATTANGTEPPIQAEPSTTRKLRALESVAQALIVHTHPALADRLSVKVIVFDKDWRYTVSRNRTNCKHATIRLYVCDATDPARFRDTVIAAAHAARDLFNDEIRVPVQDLLEIRHVHPAIDAILRSKGY